MHSYPVLHRTEATKKNCKNTYKKKKKKGTNETPRFNQKVTSLIYFAQGDGNTKLQLSDDYFETDKKIYFDSNLTPSGVGGGYHLAIPAES